MIYGTHGPKQEYVFFQLIKSLCKVFGGFDCDKLNKKSIFVLQHYKRFFNQGLNYEN